ncbi:hypothetical protein K788_0003180 [Paraburkholderia caribensis MBA4]|uniref:Uncharacterized protein n=1 Tax=Paraburkholderia caribensis MBA4 TaxID=1323664 RepID=A0A0P0RDC0_9BURK|nr:hypothetical protein K788_0003180 [Paraburkholderia caribensis MBA4]
MSPCVSRARTRCWCYSALPHCIRHAWEGLQSPPAVTR